jgi:hypothetical protein
MKNVGMYAANTNSRALLILAYCQETDDSFLLPFPDPVNTSLKNNILRVTRGTRTDIINRDHVKSCVSALRNYRDKLIMKVKEFNPTLEKDENKRSPEVLAGIIADEHKNEISKLLFAELLNESFIQDPEEFIGYPENFIKDPENFNNGSAGGGVSRGDGGMIFGAVVLGVTALFASLRVG